MDAGTNGTITATGGGGMNLTTPLTLCQRADMAQYRGFDGRWGDPYLFEEIVSLVPCDFGHAQKLGMHSASCRWGCFLT